MEVERRGRLRGRGASSQKRSGSSPLTLSLLNLFFFFFPSQTAIEVLDMKSCLVLALNFSTAPIGESEKVSLKWISQPNLLLGDRGPCWVLLGAQAREKVTFFSRYPTTIQPL